MSEVENGSVEREKREFVALNPTTAAKVDRWIEQIKAKKSVKISRRQFLAWYIEVAPDNLSGGEVNAAIERFYDTETHLRQLLRDVKKAKASGQGDGGVDLVLRTKKPEARKDIGESPEDSGLTLGATQSSVGNRVGNRIVE